MKQDYQQALLSMKHNTGKVVLVSKLNSKIVAQLKRINAMQKDSDYILVNENENVFYYWDKYNNGGIPFPYLLIVDNVKYYYPNGLLVGMDASALADYVEIVRKARAGEGRSKSTCDAVLIIADEFVLRLENLISSLAIRQDTYIQPVTLNSYTIDNIREWRGMIDRAKFCVWLIWKEGKSTKR